jgi:hypothetical protein
MAGGKFSMGDGIGDQEAGGMFTTEGTEKSGGEGAERKAEPFLRVVNF